MRVMKYIIIGGDTPIIFPDHLTHAEVALKFGGRERVSGAGFCGVNGRDECGNALFECYGESVSLKIKSGPDDSRIMNRAYGTTY